MARHMRTPVNDWTLFESMPVNLLACCNSSITLLVMALALPVVASLDSQWFLVGVGIWLVLALPYSWQTIALLFGKKPQP